MVQAPPVAPEKVVEVFYDGACPLCMREIRMLRARDREDAIQFTDIAADGFDATRYGTSQDELMDKIRGRLPDGSWIEGVEVFRRLWGAVGFRRLVGISRMPGIAHALNALYRVFAKHRLRLTGRCKPEGSCAIPDRPAQPVQSASAPAQ